MSGTSAPRNSNTGKHIPLWGVSWEEKFKLRHAGSPQHMAFLHANAWQRDSVGLRLAGYDGFLVVVGLFLVLLLESLLSFEPNAFESTWAGDAFLITLVLGTVFGIFTTFSTVMIKGKLQRLIVRDLATLNVQQHPGQGRKGRLDRLVKEWEQNAPRRQFQPASISYEWYNGAQTDSKQVLLTSIPRPRKISMYASISFVAMVASFGVALAIRIADSKGVVWSLFSSVLVGGAAILPVIFIILSAREPCGLEDESNPFEGFFF